MPGMDASNLVTGLADDTMNGITPITTLKSMTRTVNIRARWTLLPVKCINPQWMVGGSSYEARHSRSYPGRHAI